MSIIITIISISAGTVSVVFERGRYRRIIDQSQQIIRISIVMIPIWIGSRLGIHKNLGCGMALIAIVIVGGAVIIATLIPITIIAVIL